MTGMTECKEEMSEWEGLGSYRGAAPGDEHVGMSDLSNVQ